MHTNSICTMNQLSTEDTSAPSKDQSDVHSMALLREEFTPTDNDVICGRGRRCFNHTGNERFRAIVAGYLAQYSKANSKLEKSYILSDIVARVRANSPYGGFVKKCPETKRWYEVGDFLAREKTSQAFRDALSDQYKSSNSAKKKRRQVAQAVKFEKAYSASNLGYDAAAEPLDAYAQSSSKLMRVERPRSLSFDNNDVLLGDISEFGSSSARRGFSAADVADRMSSRSVLDLNIIGAGVSSYVKQVPVSNNSCPNFSFEALDSQAEEATQNFSWGNTITDAEESVSSKNIAQNPFLKSMNPNPFATSHISVKPNPFMDSKPYYSNSSTSLMSVDETVETVETVDERRDFRGGFEDCELTLEDILADVPDAPVDGLLASLSNVIDNFTYQGNPYEPIPLPDM